MMFSVGETVVYSIHGVCKIKDISLLKFGNEKRKYYILCPVGDGKSTLYVPLDNENLLSQMRPVMSREEIDLLIGSVSQDKTEWIEDAVSRKEYCDRILKSGNRKELMQLIEMLYLKQEELKSKNKHFHIADERCLKDAEKLLYDEFSFTL